MAWVPPVSGFLSSSTLESYLMDLPEQINSLNPSVLRERCWVYSNMEREWLLFEEKFILRLILDLYDMLMHGFENGENMENWNFISNFFHALNIGADLMEAFFKLDWPVKHQDAPVCQLLSLS